jgi:hypothetical protein
MNDQWVDMIMVVGTFINPPFHISRVLYDPVTGRADPDPQPSIEYTVLPLRHSTKRVY